jgi:hypothetical protein
MTGVEVGFVLDSETFQIPGPDSSFIIEKFQMLGTSGSFILKLFKYPGPTVL